MLDPTPGDLRPVPLVYSCSPSKPVTFLHPNNPPPPCDFSAKRDKCLTGQITMSRERERRATQERERERKRKRERMVLGPAAIGVRSLNTVEGGFAYGLHRHTNTRFESASLSKPTGKPA